MNIKFRELKKLVPKKDVDFKENKVDFSVKMEAPKLNKILPVIIKINHK